MAAAIRLSIAPIGALGAEVAALMPAGTAVIPANAAETAMAGIPPQSAIALVSPVPVPRIERALAHAAFLWKTRFLPVVIERGRLRIGPVSAPGVLGCSECYRARSRQHMGPTEAQDALESALIADPGTLVEGHLPMTAALAASAVASFSRAPAPAAGSAGEVRLYDPLAQTMFRSDVVGVHACRLCAAPRDWVERSTARLAPFVDDLLSQNTTVRGER